MPANVQTMGYYGEVPRYRLGTAVPKGVTAAEVEQKFTRLRAVKRVATVTNNGRVTVSVFPHTAGDGDLTREVITATNGWQISELRTEEGRLDEVFYNITMPDTAGKGTK